jgi:acyl-CoA synthetase (AMP-forming)/AMP-acid ligase II
MRWFDPAGLVRLAEEHQVQDGALVPSMLAMLLTQPLEEHDLSALTSVSSGGSPLAAEVRLEFERRVPSCTVFEGYGCTESATLISANAPSRNRSGSVGLPVPGCEVTIQDAAGQILPAGEHGEICVRSPGVMSGYWHTVGASADVLAGGWLHTGDIGHQDEDRQAAPVRGEVPARCPDLARIAADRRAQAGPQEAQGADRAGLITPVSVMASPARRSAHRHRQTHQQHCGYAIRDSNPLIYVGFESRVRDHENFNC